MQIHDYESGRELRDVNIRLSRDEAEELHAYLGRLLTRPELHHATISEVRGGRLETELSLTVLPTEAA
jgi:hypothetical protein